MIHLTSKLYFQSLLLPKRRTISLMFAPTVRRSYIFDFCKCSCSGVDTGCHDLPSMTRQSGGSLKLLAKLLRTLPSVRRNEFSSKEPKINFKILTRGPYLCPCVRTSCTVLHQVFI